MNILGISAYYHDSAACLVKDGEIVAAAHEERFTRKKQDDRFPTQAIAYCLREGGIGMSDLDYVVFYEKPFLKFERLLETYLAYAPSGIISFLKAMPLWLKRKLWMKAEIEQELGEFKGKLLFAEHHESHAASAFFPSPYQRAAFLTMDGMGEHATATYGIGENNRLRILATLDFPHSLGMLYSAFTYYLGFRVNSDEYKVMGLAPYGEPKYANLILEKIVDVKEDGSLHLNMEYFNYATGLTMTNSKFSDLFGGPPRVSSASLTQKDMDLARSIQQVTDEIVLKMARHVQNKTGEKYLVLAGGVALNCVANGKLLRSGIFEDIWIQPAAGDAGGALGAALLGWYQYLDNSRSGDGVHDAMKGAYLGPEFSDKEIKAYLAEHAIPFRELREDELADTVAELINNQHVIGWFQGRMEFGPRALGNRSIIGDARSPKMQEIMNLKIKFRESFRPFAPAILKEKAAEYFDIDHVSPYMLLVAEVRDSKRRRMTADEERLFGIDKLNVARSVIPAVTHIDYTARLQTVDRETNDRFYDLIAAFDRKYGCPVVINTSFNVSEEPIVCTPDNAYRCFMGTNMDYLVMSRFLIDKREQKKL